MADKAVQDFSGTFTLAIMREVFTNTAAGDAGKAVTEAVNMVLAVTAEDLKTLARQSPSDLAAKLSALDRGTSKNLYSRATVNEALRRKGWLAVPGAPGLPPQLRKITEAEAPAAK